MIVWQLFCAFLKIGLFSVGGGMATLPFLYDLSEKTGWFTGAQIADMLAVSESTPGPIGINMATYVGYTTAEIPGALAATLGIIIPGLTTVLIIVSILEKFRSSSYVSGAFYGLRPVSVALITAAGIEVVKISLFHVQAYALSGVFADLINGKAMILAAVLLLLTRSIKQTKHLHPIVFIVFSAIVGVVFSF